MIRDYSSYPSACVNSSGRVSYRITRRTHFELMIYDAYRVPSNSFTSEDDGIYGDAGGTTPTDANGDATGENEEDVHESDAGAEEEEEDSEDVCHSAQTRRYPW